MNARSLAVSVAGLGRRQSIVNSGVEKSPRRPRLAERSRAENSASTSSRAAGIGGADADDRFDLGHDHRVKRFEIIVEPVAQSLQRDSPIPRLPAGEGAAERAEHVRVFDDGHDNSLSARVQHSTCKIGVRAWKPNERRNAAASDRREYPTSPLPPSVLHVDGDPMEAGRAASL